MILGTVARSSQTVRESALLVVLVEKLTVLYKKKIVRFSGPHSTRLSGSCKQNTTPHGRPLRTPPLVMATNPLKIEWNWNHLSTVVVKGLVNP